jgi:membrane associated rhomboid family serine protease
MILGRSRSGLKPFAKAARTIANHIEGIVWLFARPANHIGASGVVYSLAFFLIFFGLFRRDFVSILISVLTLLHYGGVFYGVLPTDPRVSWESHFAGAAVGIFSAVYFSTKKRVD